MHEAWQSQLPLYVAGVLPPDEREAIEAHLTTCEDCRALVREWERIGAAVRGEAAARVAGASLPPLPERRAAISRNGRSSEHPAWGQSPYDHQESDDMMSIAAQLTQIIDREWPHQRPRLHLAPTLIAAVLLAVLFGGALLLFNARQDGDTTSPGASSGGDANQPAAIQESTTEPPTPLPTTTPIPTQPVVITATPVLPTAIPPQDAEAMPPASDPSQVVITATPMLFEGPTADMLVATIVPPHVVLTAMPMLFEGPAADMLAPTIVPPPVPPGVALEGVRYEAQGWNNAGPATLAMALSYHGWDGDQDTAADWLKPDPEDKSVSPWQMVAYVNGQTTYRAIYRMGGTLDALKSAVAAGLPVIAAVGMDTESDGWFGHYQLVTGYDEGAGVLLVYDSYLGPATEPRRVPYSDFDAAWWPFNRTFVIVFPADRVSLVQAALRGHADPAFGVRMALDAAWSATTQSPEDVWGWLNLGTAYSTLGRFEDAATAYDRALGMSLPFRALWYQFGPFEAYFGAGRYDDVLALAASVLEATPYIEEAHYWQALAHAAQGEVEDASRALEQLIALNPNFFVGELARFQTAPDALAQELLGSVTLAPDDTPPVITMTPADMIPQGTPILATPIRIEPTPSMPPVLAPTGTPIIATPIRVEPTPTPIR